MQPQFEVWANEIWKYAEGPTIDRTVRLHGREYYGVMQYMGGQDAGHGGVLPDMDTVNACTHVMSAENVPGMDFLSVRTYTSI